MLNNSSLIKFECIECLDDIELVISELNPEIKEIMVKENICLTCFNENYFKCWNCGQYHNYNDMLITLRKIKLILKCYNFLLFVH